MIKADLYFNIFLLGLSIFAFVEGMGYPYMHRGVIGSGFFPVWMSAFLFILSLVNIIKILRSFKTGEDKKFFTSKNHRTRIVVFFISLIVYIIAITYLGMLVATLLYALFVYKIFDKFTWKATLPPAVGIVVCVYVIFYLVLGLRLPVGLWN